MRWPARSTLPRSDRCSPHTRPAVCSIIEFEGLSTSKLVCVNFQILSHDRTTHGCYVESGSTAATSACMDSVVVQTASLPKPRARSLRGSRRLGLGGLSGLGSLRCGGGSGGGISGGRLDDGGLSGAGGLGSGCGDGSGRVEHGLGRDGLGGGAGRGGRVGGGGLVYGLRRAAGRAAGGHLGVARLGLLLVSLRQQLVVRLRVRLGLLKPLALQRDAGTLALQALRSDLCSGDTEWGEDVSTKLECRV